MTLLSDRYQDIRTLVRSTDPGAVWAVGGPEGVYAASQPPPPAPALPYEITDLTPALALWPVLGSLVEEGALRLHTPLGAYGEPAGTATISTTTAHHLLTHGEAGAWTALTRLAEHLGAGSLAELAATRVWAPLGMTGIRLADDGTLYAPLPDLARFLGHLLSPEGRAWTAESLRIRTGELTPARGLLWLPAPHGVWTTPAPHPAAPALWLAPRHRRWALLLPAAGATLLRTAFREAVFGPPA